MHSPFGVRGGPALSGFFSVQVIMVITEPFLSTFLKTSAMLFTDISQEGGEAFCRLNPAVDSQSMIYPFLETSKALTVHVESC